MMSIPIAPKTSTHVIEPRSDESVSMERMQNIKLLSLGIDPYEYDNAREYTEEEKDIINEVIKLITLNKNVPEELAEKVKKITGKTSENKN